MKIRKFIGKNMKEILQSIKETLGDDAIILSSRKISGGFEVLAAADLNIDELKNTEPRKMIDIVDSIKKSETPPVSVDEDIDKEKTIDRVLFEIDELKKLIISHIDRKREMEKLANEVENIKKILANMSSISVSSFANLDEEALSLFGQLKEMEIADDIIKIIMDEVSKEELLSPFDVAEHVIKNLIISKNFQPEKGKPAVFVGPTGVGKTTTIAKIAAIYGLFSNKDTALISIDTYRIGATDQLKIYSELLGVEFYSVNTPDEFREITSLLSDKDVILVDTAGRAPRDEIKFEELKSFLEAIVSYSLIIVLSVTHRSREIVDIIKRFKVKEPEGIIFTKLDETCVYGSMLNIFSHYKYPIIYITTGQRVPEDIEVADPLRISRLILGREKVQ